jgi:N-acetylglucosamine-6-phosphate deacetylase
MKILKCGKLVTPDKILNSKYVIIENNKITSIEDDITKSLEKNIIDYTDKIIGPGLVDIHCHGALNSDFADGDIEGITKAAQYHLQKGTTTVLATVGSCMPNEMIKAMNSVRDLQDSVPNLYGVHLEGPFFNKEWYGCHLFEAIRNPQKSEWINWNEYIDIIKMVTLAPELQGADEFMQYYKDSGIVFSIGHSDANFDQITNAVTNNLTHSCHLFCAQPRASRNNYVLEPAVFESVLMIDDLTVEIICDGIHVGPQLVEFACKIKGTDKIALVSDALRGVGCPPGDYAFGPKNGQMCRIIKDPKVGVVPNEKGKLASSAIVLSDGIGIFSKKTNLPLEQIWKMASTVPAKILNISDQKGSIKKGLDADILVMNNDFSVHAVYVRGEMIESSD